MTGFVTKKISRPRTLGSILKAARSKRSLTIEQAEKETCIPAKHLLALESGNYDAMPAEAYNIGYVRTYAQFLKLREDRILQLYREERSSKRVGPQEKVTLSPRRANDWKFLVTPKVVGVLTATLLFIGIGAYIYVQLLAFASPPDISLKVPTQFTSTKDTVAVAGQTEPGATVLMNNQDIAVAADGNFNQTVQLSPGVNQVIIQAKNRANKQSQVAVKILYDQQGVASLPSNTLAN